MPWTTIGWIALGGAVGANLRFWLGAAITRGMGLAFPWGTLAANLSGAFLAGVLAVLLERGHLGHQYRLLLMTGLLGGFTTFSAYELEVLGLWTSRRYALAFLYLFGSAVIGFLAVMAGFAATNNLFHVRE